MEVNGFDQHKDIQTTNICLVQIKEIFLDKQIKDKQKNNGMVYTQSHKVSNYKQLFYKST